MQFVVNFNCESRYQFFVIRKFDCLLFQSDFSQTNSKILSNQFDFFYRDYIINTTNKVMYVFKINVFFDLSNKVIDMNKLVFMHKVEKIEIDDVLSRIIVNIFDIVEIIFILRIDRI